MKLIYITAKKYPAITADHIFMKEMALAFGKILQKDFLFVAANIASGQFDEIPHKSLGLKIRRGLSLYYLIWLLFFIIKERLNNKETIFYSNDANLLSILIFYKKIFRFKYSVVSEWHMLFGDWRDLYVSRNSEVLITTTEHLKNIISTKFNIENKKIKSVYGGVKLERFVSEIVDHILPDSFVVGYVGFYKTMGMEKGINTMIESLALIQHENVKNAFVGGRTDEIREYSEIALKKGVSNRTLFVSAVRTEEVPSYERSMDILVIPYPDAPHFRNYGFPMKVYEYMASKKPIIYSNLEIISEVLGDCAISFKAGDAKDLADKIIYIKNNPKKGQDLAMKAWDKVQEFTWEKRAENITAFLKGI